MVDGAYIRQWIHLRYKACQFKRYMSESDMSVRPLPTQRIPVGINTPISIKAATACPPLPEMTQLSKLRHACVLLCSGSAPAPGRGMPGLSEICMYCYREQKRG